MVLFYARANLWLPMSLLTLGLVAPVQARQAPDISAPSSQSQQAFADNYLPILAAAMGLPVAVPVPLRTADEQALQAVLLRAMARQYPGDILAFMSQAYAAIGLVPKGTNLRAEALKLYQSQIAGFCDPSDHRMFLMAGAADAAQSDVLRHELAHALQDQAYPLQPRIDAAAHDDDEALALQAVLEGQAMVAMDLNVEEKAASSTGGPAASTSGREEEQQAAAVQEMFRGTDVSLSADEVATLSHAQAQQTSVALTQQLRTLTEATHTAADTSRQAMAAASTYAQGLMASASDAIGDSVDTAAKTLGIAAAEDSHLSVTSETTPAYLQKQLSFPYVEGKAFIESLAQDASLATVVNRTLARPPRSTREVLHPSLYGQPLPKMAPLSLEREAGHTILWYTTVGELNMRTLLMRCKQGAELASKLRADRLILFTTSGGGSARVAWRSRWRDAASAKRFVGCLQELAPGQATQQRHNDVGLLGCQDGATCDGQGLLDQVLAQ